MKTALSLTCRLVALMGRLADAKTEFEASILEKMSASAILICWRLLAT